MQNYGRCIEIIRMSIPYIALLIERRNSYFIPSMSFLEGLFIVWQDKQDLPLKSISIPQNSYSLERT
jgi:hypothetical protein